MVENDDGDDVVGYFGNDCHLVDCCYSEVMVSWVFASPILSYLEKFANPFEKNDVSIVR